MLRSNWSLRLEKAWHKRNWTDTLTNLLCRRRSWDRWPNCASIAMTSSFREEIFPHKVSPLLSCFLTHRITIITISLSNNNSDRWSRSNLSLYYDIFRLYWDSHQQEKESVISYVAFGSLVIIATIFKEKKMISNEVKVQTSLQYLIQGHTLPIHPPQLL